MNANNAQQFTGQQAVIDLSKMDALASKVGTFGNTLVTASGNCSGEILDAFVHTNSTDLDDPANCDLLEFCNLVRQEPNLKLIPQIMTATTDVINAISAAVPMTMTNAMGLSRGGLCIYIPYQTNMFDSANYVQCEWRSTNWHSFVSKLIGALGGGGGGDKGWISINSTPQGAAIWVNGTNSGATTPALLEGAPNTYQIKLTLSGYQDWQQDVAITAGETTYVNATLQQQGGGDQLTVSGTVTWSGHSLSNYCIAFLDTSHTTTIYPVGIVQVNPGNGAYTIQVTLGGVLPAYVEAFDDVNNNGSIDTGEGFGYWDQNNNGEWDDMINFQPGQTVTNANIGLQTVTSEDQANKRRMAER
jgi:hypothetical protein